MDDYERGFEQFKQMVGDDRIDALINRFKSICPDFEKEVVSIVGGRIWARPGIDLKTRSLCSIGLWTNPAPISEMICAIKCIKALAFSRFLVS